MTDRASRLDRAPRFHLGMLGPLTVSEYREHLFPGEWRDSLPRGQGGSPLNLLCRELLARGQRLTLFTADSAVEEEVILSGPLLRICIVPYGRAPGRRPARDFFAVERRDLLASIRRERPELLHAQWTYEYALAAQASGLPHVITAHDAPLNVLRRELIPYRIAHTAMAFRVISRARRIVSVSPYVAEHLRRYMLYRGDPLVIPNGMPDEVFMHPARRDAGTPGVTYATVLNGWTRLKNGRTALEAFARVHALRPRDRLVMLGAGHEPGGPAESWGRRNRVTDGVEFAGARPHDEVVARLSRDVDVLVHPSLEEACSMAIIEASAIGVPCVGGIRSGAVPWLLDDGRAGLLVDVTSGRRLAEGMCRLAGDPELRGAMAARARRVASERFRIGRVADEYRKVYETVVGER